MRVRRGILIGLTVGLLAASCGGGDDDATETTDDGGNGGSGVDPAACGLDELAAAEKPVEITFWHAMARTNADWLVAQIDEFNASQSDVRVNLVQQPNYQDSFTKYQAGLSTGDLPDLVQLEETVVQKMLDTRSTIDVQSCVDAAGYDMTDFLERAPAYYSTGGVLRTMPWVVSNPVLMFDSAKFEQAGLDPADPPETLEEVREYSQKIVDSGAARHGIALRVEPYVFEFLLAKSGGVYVDNGNGRQERATAATFGDETGLAIWEWWNDMVDAGLAVDTGGLPNNFDHMLAIGNDDAAMAFEACGILGIVRAVLEGGEYPGTVIVAAPLPALDTGGGVPVGDSSLWIPSSSDPAKRAAAWKVIEYLVSPELQASLAVEGGFVPIRESSTEEPELQAYWDANPPFRVGYDQLTQGELSDANTGSLIGDYQGVRDAVRNGMTRMLEQGIEPADAIAQAESEGTSAIAAYNARVEG